MQFEEHLRAALPMTDTGEAVGDPDGMNARRAEWGGEAIDRFQQITGTEDEDALADLLCDLMHWARESNQSFHLELCRAVTHYEAETDDNE